MITFSTSLPIPEAVIPRPPNICVASSAISRPVRVTYLMGCLSLLSRSTSRKEPTASEVQLCRRVCQIVRRSSSAGMTSQYRVALMRETRRTLFI